jgi:hypothetical protein
MENTVINKNIQIPEMTFQVAYKWSIVCFVAFLAMFVSFPLLQKFPNVIYLSTILAIVFHISLLPMVVAMPAPAWTKIGGYTWAVVDIILAVAGLNGVPNVTIEPLRFGVHVTLVIWPIGIAMVNAGFIRWASVLFAITTGAVPLFGTNVPAQARFIGLPFIIMWFIAMMLTFRKLKTNNENLSGFKEQTKS